MVSKYQTTKETILKRNLVNLCKPLTEICLQFFLVFFLVIFLVKVSVCQSQTFTFREVSLPPTGAISAGSTSVKPKTDLYRLGELLYVGRLFCLGSFALSTEMLDMLFLD